MRKFKNVFYVITDSGVYCDSNLEKINKELNSKLEIEEFKVKGNDRIICLSNSNLDYVQDKKRLSMIPMSNLYKKDSLIKVLSVVNTVLLLLAVMNK